MRGAGGDDRGSILPLIVGYGALCGVLLVIAIDITSLYTHQRRVDALADAVALAAADGFVLEPGPIARLDAEAARVHAETVLGAAGDGNALVAITMADAITVRVSITSTWHPPLAGVGFPDGVSLGAVGTARTALQ